MSIVCQGNICATFPSDDAYPSMCEDFLFEIVVPYY